MVRGFDTVPGIESACARQTNWRDYNAASYAGRKGVETLVAIHTDKFIMNLKTFLAAWRSELRADGKRREYDQKLFVAMEDLEDAMHAHLSGSWRLSKLFVAVRKHELVRMQRARACPPRRNNRAIVHSAATVGREGVG
jgi:hypothetical protein